MYNVYVIAGIQVLADIMCFVFSLLALRKNDSYKLFFIINAIAFFILTFGDIYYNYLYRISMVNISESLGFVVTISLLTFQLSQAYNWYSVARKNNHHIFSTYNLPYLLFTVILVSIFIYYFLTASSSSTFITWNQSISVSLDMIVWFFAIICLASSRSLSITLLTFGCLILISGDLSSRCLFMLAPDQVQDVHWIHVVRTSGAVCMALGFIIFLKDKKFKSCPPHSIQESCCFWLSTTSLAAFIIGFLFLTIFSLNHGSLDIRSILWNLPIALVFTMLTSVVLGNWFSNIILAPIDFFLKRIEKFNSGNLIDVKNNSSTELYEFKELEGFINGSFNKISTQLDREMKIAAQVAHDIRSPLSALQALAEEHLTELEESKRILLRDAIYQIRDIANNLDQHSFAKEMLPTQIIILLEYVLSERRVAFAQRDIKIQENFSTESYSYFSNIIPSEFKRVMTNLINNGVEAIKSGAGKINVFLLKEDNYLLITIKDNGIGIVQETFDSIFTRGFTTKENGSGLGLFYARETIKQWSGSIDIQSTPGKGTCITIKLPAYTAPTWFTSELKMKENSIVVCVDDSISIWNAWQERFKLLNPSSIKLRYCHDKQSLLRELGKDETLPCIYLVDYEFSGQNYTGIDLIKKIIFHKKPIDQIFLVTSRSGKDIHDFCIETKISMISKLFALKIPVTLIQ